MNINKKVLVSSYNYLLTLKPFSSWGLLPANCIKFGLKTKVDCVAHFAVIENDKFEIAVNNKRISHLSILLECLAHEMVHQAVTLLHPNEVKEHGPHFIRLSKIVSKELGYDPLYF